MPRSLNDMPTDELLANLEAIANLKNELPLAQQGYCSELGLHVQLRDKGDLERLQAGGRFRTRIDMWRNSGDSAWEVKKYKPGEWEALVEPTLTLARWLADRGGVPEHARASFLAAIAEFSGPGQLELPMSVWSLGSSGHLGRLSAGIVVDTEPKLKELIAKLHEFVIHNPNDATGWDAIANAYSKLRAHKEALEAVNHALQLAPRDGGIHYTALVIQLGALEEAGTPRSENDFSRFVEPLGTSHSDALDAVPIHAKAVIDGAGTSAQYQITDAATIVNAKSSAAEQAERAVQNLRKSSVWRD